MKEYSIREVSEMFQLPQSTLRYYEEAGILTNVGRSPSGRRIYYSMHINRLRTICCFKKAGMSIAQLQQFFTYESSLEDHIDDILSLLEAHRDLVAEELQNLQSIYAHILRKLQYYGDIKACQNAGKPIPEWKDYRMD